MSQSKHRMVQSKPSEKGHSSSSMSLLSPFLRGYGSNKGTQQKIKLFPGLESQKPSENTQITRFNPNNKRSHHQIYLVNFLSFLRKQLFPELEVPRVHISFKLQNGSRQTDSPQILPPAPTPSHHQQPIPESPFFPKVDLPRHKWLRKEQFLLFFLRCSWFFQPQVLVFPCSGLWTALKIFQKEKRCENESKCAENSQGP